ncbi:MAG: beta-lactamase family protein [Planctomycetaceae bacterium]|jgi:CubicO group peptidase (beta-lactamase class C family)|nr:beta-lactamase family protein [Planctomycetaceae bacterium]
MKNICSFLSVIFVLYFPVVAEEFAVKSVLQPYIDNGEMAGFVTAIASKDEILQLDTLGYQDRETKKPMQTDTLFWVASQSKPITATAVMILADDGKLNLDEPITTYLPEFSELRVLLIKNETQTILVPCEHPPTLRQLLSHTSGMDWGGQIHRKFGFDILSFAQEATLFPTIPFVSQPGTKSLYSNMGINTAAMIVERISGQPYAVFLQQRLFEPLEMTNTTFIPDLNRLAKPYRFDKSTKKIVETENTRFSHPLDNRNRQPDAAAGLFSTAKDIVNFYRMLLGGGVFEDRRILSENSVREITSKQTGVLPQQYGLGMEIYKDGFGHGGTFGTMTKTRTTKNRILVYMTQEQQLPKAIEARETFFKLLP